MIIANTAVKAWEILFDFMPEAVFNKNHEKSEAAGYNVYEFANGYVCDLNTRLEINFNNGKTRNIWIEKA